MTSHPNRSRAYGAAFFNPKNTPGYSGNGLRNLNRAREIIIEEYGLDMGALPPSVVEEMDRKMRDRLTRYGSDLPVRTLLLSWSQE
jgi:hypothetical protein